MKKAIFKIFAICMTLAVCLSSIFVAGCGKEADLRVYNCYEYIDESLITEFEKYYEEKTGKKIKVQYDCFDTPEHLYNDLTIDGSRYDLVCPSDYMIQKMAVEGMLEEIELPENGDYNKNVSPFIKQKLSEVTWQYEGQTKNLAQYAAGYMWGTLGLVYNPEKVPDGDVETWKCLWESKYKNKFTIKDSVRDTYFIGLAHEKYDDLMAAKGQQNYAEVIKDLFNDTTESTVNAVKSALFNLKDNSRGMEVDEGKEEMIKGNIDIYFAWSGDAVYAMDEAEENGMTLKYSVPEEGSNIWFDGWCVPKNAKNKELALEFIDFLSKPESVIKNMEYIGYTSCIGGDEVFEWVAENYSDDEGEISEDLSYFFGDGDYEITYSEELRQFATLYPSEDVIGRCAVMNYFNDEANDRITTMWIQVKTH